MPLARTLTLLAPLCLVTACGGFKSPDIPAPPAALVAPCARPVALPDRGMSQSEVEQFWRRDRIALADCGDRLEGLAGFMGDLRRQVPLPFEPTSRSARPRRRDFPGSIRRSPSATW